MISAFFRNCSQLCGISVRCEPGSSVDQATINKLAEQAITGGGSVLQGEPELIGKQWRVCFRHDKLGGMQVFIEDREIRTQSDEEQFIQKLGEKKHGQSLPHSNASQTTTHSGIYGAMTVVALSQRRQNLPEFLPK